ncbi:MAG: hypothetical protein KGO96_07700 [Elusimicrobia bacterium]|nr:hypothetical protein [Elusimicrobiota bacterium]
MIGEAYSDAPTEVFKKGNIVCKRKSFRGHKISDKHIFFVYIMVGKDIKYPYQNTYKKSVLGPIYKGWQEERNSYFSP